jgi:putative transposase
VKYAAIADWAQEKEYSVTFMCDQLGVVCQGYYRWRSAGPCERERTDVELTEAILAIHTELDGNPGVRRVWAELTARGVQVSPKRTITCSTLSNPGTTHTEYVRMLIV